MKQYPEGYFRFGGHYAYTLSNEETQRMIGKCVDHLKANKDENEYWISTGDTKVSATRYEDEGIVISVYKDYYELTIADK